MDRETLKAQIIESCRFLHFKNMLAAADGNVSVKISDDEILITPTGLHKAFLAPSDIAVVTLDNRVVSGAPSGERLMHLEIYRSCPKARSVIHAHPPTAIAWSVAKPRLTELPADCLSEVILAVGNIPIVPYARPGTDSMGKSLKPFLPRSRALILARHGAVCWGETLPEAFNGMERIEHSAQILLNAQLLGGLRPLPENEVRALHALRAQLGDKSL